MDLADLVAGLAPDVDDLVVALARGHQTGDVLLLDLLDQVLGSLDQLVLCFGTSMSSMAIEMPARVARRKPSAACLSRRPPCPSGPHLRNEVLIRREISFLSGLVQVARTAGPRKDLGQGAADGGRDQRGLGHPFAGDLVVVCTRSGGR